jgi:hypothetical protein
VHLGRKDAQQIQPGLARALRRLSAAEIVGATGKDEEDKPGKPIDRGLCRAIITNTSSSFAVPLEQNCTAKRAKGGRT